VKLDNIRRVIDGDGQITLGDIGLSECVAVASDGTRTLAMLVRGRGESLEALLARLDGAIARALDEDIVIDEIN
jgi:hypothetical protein